MTGGRDKVKKCMDTVISKPRVTLDARLFGQDVIVLTFEVPDNFREALRIGSA